MRCTLTVGGGVAEAPIVGGYGGGGGGAGGTTPLVLAVAVEDGGADEAIPDGTNLQLVECVTMASAGNMSQQRMHLIGRLAQRLAWAARADGDSCNNHPLVSGNRIKNRRVRHAPLPCSADSSWRCSCTPTRAAPGPSR